MEKVLENVGHYSLDGLHKSLENATSVSEVIGIYLLTHKEGFDSLCFDFVAARLCEIGEPNIAVEFAKMGEVRRLREEDQRKLAPS